MMRIAISGAGVAGPALAHWLARCGHEVTLIEKAPRFRTGGYVIDFWGVGYTIAERMGILPAVLDAGYSFRELRLVDRNGRKVGGLSTEVFRRMTGGRFTSLPRGDLAAAIYGAVEARVETLFGNSVSEISESGDTVTLAFEHGPPREFDLLVGADGLHSKVRELAFGPQQKFEKDLGYRVATFEVQGYRPRDELVYTALATPGKQLARIALRGDRTTFLLVFRADRMSGSEPRSMEEKREVLRGIFADSGWESGRMLEAMSGCDTIYFDRVSQIRMPSWSKGRVVLVGDAAAAVSLLAGEGTGLGMTEAYVLAGELARAGGDHRAAFQRYEQTLRPFVEDKQVSAERFASSFAPGTAFGVWFRNQATKMMRLPFVADMLVGKSIRDDFDLPAYDM